MDRTSPQPRRLQNQYLVSFNFTCAVLWLAVLGRVILLVPLVGFNNVYGGVGNFVKWTQTLALLEVLHSALRLVRSPLPTTVMQVSSRILLVWGVIDMYPSTTTQTPFYSTMLVAWSITEVIRYSYFVLNLQGWVPGFVTWLRYNTFYVLYPMGITSEVMLIWKASGLAGKQNQLWQWTLWGIMAVYVPGSYILYTHMITQRRKVMKGKAPGRSDQVIN